MRRGFCRRTCIGAWVPLCLALHASAEQAPPAPGQPACIQERELMTPAEVADHREKMRSLQSDGERAAFRRANHEEMAKRAAARGTVLCDERVVGPTPGEVAPSPTRPPASSN